ncbi:hypothetical protein [Streptomyces alkaliterrae]|uniref:N-formylglutamate amidohydrolase n=1 Tax=Streptomyces alkaliterrae TaxID=2213162 RepID=A0A5P0YRB0_9ACTN|nr:hypothetical protein [Streptomyces alkaliterrae]MBB1256414.1 hypothetical protein [Streptomyces alkaliterrae]MBB1259992.1 hypothetical protein [Streptomyces alkaliterrae]MQS02854.1 hypothetical protein [Streptomyces alkaliterrae]
MESVPTPAGQVDLRAHVLRYVDGIGRDTGYRAPEEAERRTVASGVGLLLDGRLAPARERLAEADYRLRVLTDEADGRRYAEVSDGAGEYVRGWGRVYVALDGPARWSVQIPHPIADLDSERLGVDTLRGAPGGVLVLAGAHRRAGERGDADVAHRSDTVFHEVTRELVARGLPGLQLHGFANKTVPGRHVVVSTGAGDHALPEARELADGLAAAGFRTCRAWRSRCVLEGRTNKQGRQASEAEVPFLHLEFNRDVRADEELSRRAVAELSRVAEKWAKAGARSGAKAGASTGPKVAAPA